MSDRVLRTALSCRPIATRKLVVNVINTLAFVRFAKSLAAANGNYEFAQAFAKSQSWPDESRIVRLLKSASAAVASGSLPIPDERLDFHGFLRPKTILDKLRLVHAPLAVRLMRVTSGARGSFTAEGSPTPVRQMALSSPTLMTATMVRAIAVVSKELAQMSNPSSESVIAEDLSAGIVAEADLRFVDPYNAGDSATPAGIFYGAPSVPSSGSTVAAIDADLEALANLMIAQKVPLTAPAWIMSRQTKVHLALMRSSGQLAYPTVSQGRLLDFPIVDSENVEYVGSPYATIIGLVDASQILVADDGTTVIEHSGAATLQMTDSPAAGAQPLVSLWQNNLVGFRVGWAVNWARRVPAAAAFISGVTF